MMKNNILLVLIIIMMLIINTILLMKITESNEKLKYEEKLNTTVDIFRTREKQAENFIIDSTLRMNKLSGEDICINSLINKNPILVFRIAETNCWSCVDELLTILNKDEFKNLKQYTIGVSSNYEKRYFYSKFRRLNLDIPFYTMDIRINVCKSLDDINVPYFFIMLPTMKAQMIFIPEKGKADLTMNYLKNISRKYFID